MIGETDASVSGWSVDTIKELIEKVEYWRDRFDAERDRRLTEITAERDRRLTEVAIEREKALKIKETANLAALGLAREIQTYKDEKANELRSQIERERGSYPTRSETASEIAKVVESIKPLTEYVSGQQGRTESRREGRATVSATTQLLGALFAALVLALGFYAAVRASKPAAPAIVPVTVTAPTP